MLNTLAENISFRNRINKYNLFVDEFNPSENDKILDVGANDHEYSPNDNILEKLYKYKYNITVLGIHPYNEFKQTYPEINSITYDGNIFPFKNKEFDICWSNAVLEHVGSRHRQILFIKEILRTSKKAFITTPNKKFPVELHTRIPLLHYLPKEHFDKILCKLNKSWASGDYMNLLSYKELTSILAEAGVKKFRIKKNRLLFFTMDFVVIIEG